MNTPLLVMLLLTKGPVLYGHSAGYDQAVRTQLALPGFEKEARGADFALRATVLPSFHAECSVTVLRRGRKAEAIVRCAKESIWNALQTQKSLGPPLVDRFELTATELESVEQIGGEIPSWIENKDEWWEDGMITTIELATSSKRTSLEVQHRGGAPDSWIKKLEAIIKQHGAKSTEVVSAWSSYLVR